jgi:hypothetical protein
MIILPIFIYLWVICSDNKEACIAGIIAFMGVTIWLDNARIIELLEKRNDK